MQRRYQFVHRLGRDVLAAGPIRQTTRDAGAVLVVGPPLAVPTKVIATDLETDDMYGQVHAIGSQLCGKLAGCAAAVFLAIGDQNHNAGFLPIIQNLGRLLNRTGQWRAPRRAKPVNRIQDCTGCAVHRREPQVDVVASVVFSRAVNDQPKPTKRRNARHGLVHRPARFEDARLIQLIEAHLGHRTGAIEHDHCVFSTAFSRVQCRRPHRKHRRRQQQRPRRFPGLFWSCHGPVFRPFDCAANLTALREAVHFGAANPDVLVIAPHNPYHQINAFPAKETPMFKGLGQMGDMAKMMKAAQEMQQKMAQLQEDMHSIMVEGESGAGLVKATATAKGELKALDIDPSIFNSDDKEVVEDLILAAIKDAQSKANDRAQEEMAKLTEGMGLPKDMKLPF